MADFLGGLLSGGGGLYDDLLTPQQRDQLSSRGLLAMAGAFADAGMPSRLPIPLGAAIGKAAAAMGGGRDEAALKLLQGQKLSQEVQSMKATAALQQQFMDDLRSGTMSDLVKAVMRGSVPGVGIPTGATSAAPAAAAPPGSRPGAVPPGAFSAVPALADQGAALDAAPDITLPDVTVQPPAAPSITQYGMPPRRDLSRYGLGPGAGLLGAAPGDAPPADPTMKASSLDTVPPSGGGLLTAASYNGAAAPRRGNAWLNANAPFPTLQRPGGAPIQWTNDPAPSGVPFGQDPGDSLPGQASAAPATNLDTVVPPPGRPALANMLQQVADKGGAPGASGAPTPPVPPGVDPQAMNALLLELAKRNAMAEILKLGNPYGSMLSVLQGSPAYQGQIETAKRGAGLPFVGPEEAAKRGAGYPFDVAMEAFKTANQGYLKDKEQYGAAFYEPAPNGILVPDPATGGTKRVQGTREQFARATRGLGVPELGIPALVNPPTGAAGPAVSPVGEQVPSEEDKAAIQARGAAQTEMYKAGQKALDTAHAAVLGANQRAPYYGSMLTAMEGFKPGATAEARLTAMQYLRDAGVIKGDNVPQGEALRLAGERLAFLAVPPNQGSWSNVERQLLKSSIGGMSMTAEGLTDAIRMMQQLDDYDRKVSEIHRQVADKNKGLPNLLEAQRRVEALGPPLSPQQEAALERLRQSAAAPGGGANATKPANEIIQNGWRYDATTHKPIGPVQ